MADNTELSLGSGGDVIATDDIAGVKYQRVKLTHGADGSATDVSSASPLPVTVASITAGDNNIGNVDVASLVPGTGATNLGKAEDAAHTSGDVGVMALAVRQNSQSDLGADGDYVPLTIDDSGGVRVSIVAGAGSGGTAAADDADFTAGTTQGTPAMGVYESTPTSVTDGDLGTVGITQKRALKVAVVDDAGAEVALATVSELANANALHTTLADGNGDAVNPTKAEDAAHTSGDIGIPALAVRRDTAAVGSGTDGDYSTLNVNSAGRLYTSSTVDAALPAGTNLIGRANIEPQTGNGLSIFRSIDLDETEEEVKATAGALYGWYIANLRSSPIYVKFYNATAANVTVGTTTPVMTLPVPANSTNFVAANMSGAHGIAFSTAISVAATTGLADNDTGAPGANECVVNLWYK